MPPRALPLLCGVAALVLTPRPAAAARVTVDAAAAVRAVDERVFGVNAVMWDPQTGADATIELLREAGIRTIRVPGGSLSDEYHWWSNRTLANTWTWAAGFDAFARLIDGLGAQAFVTVNYGTGTPEEAAAWVAYANASADPAAPPVVLGTDAKGRDWGTAAEWAALRAAAPLAQDDGRNFLRLGSATPFALRYWEIGNENYGTWETDERPAAERHAGFTYAQRVRDYAARMRAVDPTIKLGVVGVPSETDFANGHFDHPATNPRTGAVRNGWTPVMLATLRQLGVTPDFLIYHRYDQGPAEDVPNDPENDARLLQTARTWPQDAVAFRQMLQDYLGPTAAQVELVVTENNSVWAKPGKQTTSLVNALFLADTIGNVLQTEFNARVWWALRNSQEPGNNNRATLHGWRNYGDYGILSSPNAVTGSTSWVEPYPTFHAFAVLASFARGGDTVVSATSDDPLLAAFATRRADGRLSLLVINKDPGQPIAADFALAGFTPGPSAATTTYGLPEDEAARTGQGSTRPARFDLGITGGAFARTFPPYSLTVLTLDPVAAPALAVQPAATSVAPGAAITFAVAAEVSEPFRWQLNGVDLPGADSAPLALGDVQPVATGLYQAVATNGAGAASSPLILGLATAARVVGAGEQVLPDVRHPNGNIYDQFLLTGPATVITADPGQVARLSYIDLNDDIVQVEFSGAGTLALSLDMASGPAAPLLYHQAVNYLKGHAGLVITGADETTNVAIFSVGRQTAFDPTGAWDPAQPISATNRPENNGNPLFRADAAYDGVADVAYLAIASPTGRFGGVRAANAHFFASRGVTGLYAPGVRFAGPVFVGDITAFASATPMLVLGGTADLRLTGGALAQPNGRPMVVAGVDELRPTAGADSHGRPLPAQPVQARLERNGVDVTGTVVVGPGP